MSNRIPAPLPLMSGMMALLLFIPGLWILETNRNWTPTLLVAVPAFILGCVSIYLGNRILKSKPSGGRYGWAMVGSLAGGFSLVFWVVMVPVLIFIALPARDMDPVNEELEVSRKQIRMWVRHTKTFVREEGRFPVKLEELVEKGYAQPLQLYDPRQARRDAPSYRYMVDALPPEEEWSSVPLIEGRIPDALGRRLIAYPDETIALTEALNLKQDSRAGAR